MVFLGDEVAGIIIDHNVKSAIIVKVRDGHTARVSDVSCAKRQRHVGELQHTLRVRAVIPQEDIVLVAIPGYATTELISVEFASFVFFDVRDRAQNVGQSKIILILGTDPPIRGIDVLAAIVIIVEHGGAPVPAKGVGP